MIDLKRMANASSMREMKITEMIKGIEEGIEKKFSSQPAYRQVKAVLEGRAEKVEVKEMIKHSRAMFSGGNKPEALIGEIVDNLKNRIVLNAGTLMSDITERQTKLSESLAGVDIKAGETTPCEEESEATVMFRVAGMKRMETELKQLNSHVEKSMDALKAKLGGLKNLFVKKSA